ncbi:alpha-ketoacid dehydrogenase subunit beta [Pseudohoeflea coraliihabitans]|uniref:Alpha-ketoacid dehydrogenase subunit beta n=1 Tax=Pseudohoeflea coraliihabitans TaxID=2860393 RepID=A0ABS6WJF7_9HYPH|nr:alpha-ketoacid dehydrogenase subunit beta [Pseudohoeflea sp. DP4N28-3]MBW3095980.1 alpha-ketoacid dehydrogenase subunit beta [Pseudohoeflea sp. DP4N28-3]
MPSKTFCWAIIDAMHEEMARDEKVFLIGEDVAAAGGAFGASRGLLDAFGPTRVRDTPISEEIIVGMGVGAAMTGRRPIVEIMFIDFLGLCLDQIANQAAKTHYIYNGLFKMPLVIRTSTAVEMGIGPHHSQAWESLVAHIPGLKVVMPSTPRDAKGLLKSAIRDDNPVVFIEHIAMHRNKEEIEDDSDLLIPIGKADIKRSGTDVTVVASGLMVARALAAAEVLAKDGVSVEVLDPRTISPLDFDTIAESVSRTNRCLVVSSSHKNFGFGSEVAAEIGERCFFDLDQPVRRLSPPFTPAPFGRQFDEFLNPDTDDIVAALRDLMA